MTELGYSSPHYRLELAPTGLFARLYSPQGDELAALRPLAALDTTDGIDETLGATVRRDGDTFVVERRSTRWDEASVTLACSEDAIEVRTRVRGRGGLTDVRLLAGRSLVAGSQVGYLPSGSRFRTLFSPSPGEPASHLRPATESAAIGVLGDSDPGRRHWLFTPAPLLFALASDHDVSDPGVTLADGWTTFAVAAPVSELNFVELTYEAFESAFALRLDYDGHTRVDGAFEAPLLVIGFGAPDGYAAIARHRDDLVARGAAPAPAARETPAWWHEPIFCGWGAQCRLANLNGANASTFATQGRYDEFLGHLEGEGVVPGTITLDDKWQADYGTNEPDLDKWPDLAGWIADRHERGQRVLLWWKAWDPKGAPPELCVRNPDGAAIGLDPSNPATREFVHEMLARMLGPDGLDADGLKIDFTARTPSGRSLSHHGPAWGIALLHQLLRTVYEAAKAAKPDALVVTHTPHPAFADVTDMIRLNDVVGGSSVADQMRIRAEIVRAALPALPIDTDDWCVPNLAQWREYLAAKTSYGVPALYYSDSLDASGETFAPEDYAALRDSWGGLEERPVTGNGEGVLDPSRPATLADVAREAGTSPSTASRALSGRGYVSPAARERLLAVADRLGYIPNASARTLKQKRSRVVGVVVSDLGNQFYARLAAGIEQTLREADYQMLLLGDNSESAEEEAAVRTFLAMRAAGVIMTPVASDAAAMLDLHGIAVVELDRRLANVSCDAVVIDNERAARDATAHLLALGHRRVGLLVTDTDWTSDVGRVRGYELAHAQAGVPVDERLVVRVPFHAPDGELRIARLLHDDAPTAVFAANNLLAEQTWHLLRRTGLRLPRDLSLVAFDDVPWMGMVEPGITAVAQPAFEMGRRAALLLLRRLDEPDSGRTVEMLEPSLVVRGSTGTPPQ